jgi:hypothetical protein
MRFYKVHLRNTMDRSCGFQFFTNVADVNSCVKKWETRSHDEEYNSHYTQVEAFDTEPTKTGILKALNFHAAHPDNG